MDLSRLPTAWAFCHRIHAAKTKRCLILSTALDIVPTERCFLWYRQLQALKMEPSVLSLHPRSILCKTRCIRRRWAVFDNQLANEAAKIPPCHLSAAFVATLCRLRCSSLVETHAAMDLYSVPPCKRAIVLAIKALSRRISKLLCCHLRNASYPAIFFHLRSSFADIRPICLSCWCSPTQRLRARARDECFMRHITWHRSLSSCL
jgi:hypothetical protein